MTRLYSIEETVAVVARMTRSRLTAFIEAEVVTPVQRADGPAFRPTDLARLELMCELCDDFGLQDDALGLAITLIDQIHLLRAEMRAVLAAIAAEPDDVRARIGAALTAGP